MTPPPALDARAETRRGAFATVAAFLIWGIVPIYWKHVGAIPPIEMLGHRVIWGLPALGILLLLGRGVGQVTAALRNRRVVLTMLVSAALIGINWWIFIRAVAEDQVLEASLGYYINPLLNVFLGCVLLGERLRRLQWIAIALAAAGVAYFAIGLGTVPWVALLLASTFGMYGFVRKTVSVAALPGLFIEVLFLLLPAVLLLTVLGQRGELRFFDVPRTLQLWVPVAGLITALPLWLFSYGARRLRLATVGLVQFLAPTGQFLLAVFLYGEPFTLDHAITFGLIWAGVLLYLGDLWRGRPVKRRVD